MNISDYRYTRAARAYDGVRTRVRALRRDVRLYMGPGSDPPPDLDQALRAARALASIVDLTSSGRYGLAVYDMGSQEHLPIDEVIRHERELRKGATA